MLATVAASATVAAETKPYRLELCEAPISLVFEGLPARPPTVSERDICSTETNRSLYDDGSPFVGDQAQLDALHSHAPQLTVTRDLTGITVRIALRDESGTLRVYQASELAAHTGPGAGKRLPLVRQGHAGGPALTVSINRTQGGPFLAVDVKDALAAQLAQDAAKAASVDLQHPERLDASLKVSLHFPMLPIKTLLALVASDSQVSLTTDRNGAFVFGAVKDFKQIAELETLAYKQRGAGDNAALSATLEKIVALAQANDAGDVAMDASEPIAELRRLASGESKFADAEKWQRLLLSELEREGRNDSQDFALALIELGLLRWRQDDSDGARTQLERGLALFERHAAAPSTQGDANIAGPYLQAVLYLAAIHAGQGDFRQAIQLWQRMVDYRIEWLGEGHALVGTALRDLALLQRCASQDSEAIATLQRIKTTNAAPPRKPAREIDDALMSDLELELSVPLLPRLVDASERLERSKPLDRLRQVEVKECTAEYLTQDMLEVAALQYRTALTMRIDLQGREHVQTQRTARRALELLEQLGKGGAEEIHRQMQQP